MERGARNLARRIFSLLLAVVAALTFDPAPVGAQQPRISFIRDAEVENTIRAYATPLFTAAGLDASAIHVHLVNDRALNAFVANGLNMFINTGLLARAEHAGQVIGVIAHETGHIAGGHLARQRESLRGASAESIIAIVLGAAAAVAGRPDAGAAVIAGGLQVAERGFLRYSREMESAADQAGLTFLERSGQSARGLGEFLDVLVDQELLTVGRQDPYVLTHPITRERVDFVRNFVAHSKYADAPLRPEYAERHKRLRAKLLGFLDPGRALQVYKENDTALDARYARAIAYSRRPDYPRAFALMDSLIAERPNDGYFAELKGQLLFEAGRSEEALAAYERAYQLLPNEPLIEIGLAQVQLDRNDAALNKTAIAHLEAARRQETDSSEIWRLLAIGYGRDGQTGLTALAQAERAMLQGRRAEARAYAERAARQLPENSHGWLRAQDIRQA
ncbi:MAG: M48 family metalloprotease, partial [Proteobacteria bacterium]|nr:M48 family metalloprotease [Pseudomonadota bacterium]